ncbi:RagB/SusD family nutrient uptake outer membrane protein [Chitinophaga sedimenti]|uniref:RagB/SusD family nutrient uptake outer membrane protein n=1 Tax=Chitinophaga sedimenti TaxID=2033606 RepID=UPI00200673DB|nr:RagB/SusD family nutrient uptake outer membrane protein [Chitinophaga sedimenti]MCK7557528.1 RagB/SusD family nutrient uptake outer membrane protein [Chitinophaga sedimenti]
MKKIHYLAIAAILGLGACQKASDFLDNKVDVGLTEDAVFSDSAQTIAFLSRIYSDAPFSFVKGRGAQTEYSTDDAEYNLSSPTNQAVILYNGSVSPSNVPGDFWSTPYANIRRVNLFLKKLPNGPLSAPLKARMAGEARFLRAWFYHELLATFGGVPLVGDTVFTLNEIPNIGRATFEETVNYVVSELDAAAGILPAPSEYGEQDYGRVTRGAALALKARVLLYAASPLFNGGGETNDPELRKIISYPEFSAARWQTAADAAKAVMDAGYYDLYTDNTTAPGYGFYFVFLKRVLAPEFKPEMIFLFNRPTNKDFEGFYNPPSRGGSKTSMPTHNLVMAFPMKNGKLYNEAGSGYVATNPYANRDPRFKYTIIHNDALYYNATGASKQKVNTSNDNNPDGFNDNATGYYSRKMCDENISQNSSFNTERGWPLMRYAEVVLGYAEALNEAGQTAQAYDQLKAIRLRAGIDAGTDGLYGLKANMTQAEMRTVIQNERRIELAFEDHRWDDIRRWKIAMAVNNGFNLRMKISMATNPYTYEVVPSVRRHGFREANYLLPIPYSETRKMDKLKQNPGY